MQTRKVLIATKTYPSISTKYREICTAGILLSDDEKPQQLIRIYPIPFRYMDYDKRYPRWSIIRAEISKDEKDYRLESFRANHSTIEIIRQIDTSNNWQERKSLLLPLKFDSIKQIKYVSHTALGNISGNKNWIPPNQEEATLALLEISQIAQKETVLLLCAELQSAKCHRVSVANQLHELTGIAVKHLE